MLKTTSQHRPPIVFWACLWGVGGTFGIALIGLDLLGVTNTRLGRDFANLWAAGRLALVGQTGVIFDYVSFQQAVRDLLGAETTNYSYPPHALFMAIPFGLLPYYPAFALWTLGGAALFIWAARPFTPFPAVLAALTPAAFINIWNGHYGFIFGGLWLLFFGALNRHPTLAGLYAAVLTFKPHMGLLIALASLRRGRTVLAACAGAIGLVLASALMFGGWAEFLNQTTRLQVDILIKGNQFFYARLIPTPFMAYGGGVGGWIAHIGFTIAAAWLILRSRTTDPFALASATFLIIPYAFNYDMTVASLGFAILLYCHWQRLSAEERVIASLAFLAPALTFFSAWAVPPVLLSGLWLQLRYLSAPTTGPDA